jgi:flagella basal body P-ring formation protein FlgA
MACGETYAPSDDALPAWRRQFLPRFPAMLALTAGCDVSGYDGDARCTQVSLMTKSAFLLFALAILSSAATAYQDPAAVRKAVDDYLRVQTKGLPGQVSYSITGLDPGNNLAPCTALEVGEAPGSRAWGRTAVRVRCLQEGGWTVFVQVHIKVVANYIVAAKPLAQGQFVTDADIAVQRGDLSEQPAGTITDRAEAVGRTVSMPVMAGRPLRSDMLRVATVVQQGQSVKVVSKGLGFQVANEGRALNNATEGQVVQVRLANGQIVSGIARQGGQVEIAY